MTTTTIRDEDERMKSQWKRKRRVGKLVLFKKNNFQWMIWWMQEDGKRPKPVGQLDQAAGGLQQEDDVPLHTAGAWPNFSWITFPFHVSGGGREGGLGCGHQEHHWCCQGEDQIWATLADIWFVSGCLGDNEQGPWGGKIKHRGLWWLIIFLDFKFWLKGTFLSSAHGVGVREENSA